MRAGTHIIAGVFVGYVVGAGAGLPLVETGALGALGGLAAMLPDIDHPQSAIRQKTGLLGTAAGFWMNHRGITHTALAVALVALLAALLGPPLVALTMAGAYASHLVLDGCTPAGVPLWGPLSWRRVHVLPATLRVRTGSFAERGVALVLVVGLFWSAWNGYANTAIPDRSSPFVIIESALESANSPK